MKTAKILGTLFATFAFCIGISSCSNSTDLTELIPADSEFIVKINLRQPIENMGCRIESDGTLTLSPELSELADRNFTTSLAIAPLLELGSAVSLDEAYAFGYDNRTFAIARITDEKRLAEILDAMFTAPENEDGMKCYKIYHGYYVCIDGDVMWVGDEDEIDDVKEAASKNKIGDIPAILQWLGRDATYSIVFKTDFKSYVPAMLRGKWICTEMKFSGQQASAELVVIDRDGKRFPFGNILGEVDPDFISYVPAQCNTAIAIGEIKDTMVRSFVSGIIGMYDPAFASILNTINGTVAIAGSVNADGNIEAGNMLLMVGATQKGVNSLITMASEEFGRYECIPHELGTGLYSVAYGGETLYYGAVDGRFALSMSPIEANGQNRFADAFSGVHAAVTSEIHQAFGLPFGLKGRIWLTSDALKGEATVIDTDKNFLEALFSKEAVGIYFDMANNILNRNSDYIYDDLDYFDFDFD